MPGQQTAHRVEKSVDLGIPNSLPDTREYDTAADAELDEALCDAIDAAKAAGDDHLVEILPLQLGSHYWSSR